MRELLALLLVSLAFVAGACAVSQSTDTGKRTTVLMAGRSTFQLWFKHWNWPGFLNRHGTYREWPIPYKHFAHEGLDLTYFQMQDPRVRNEPERWGQPMLESLEARLAEFSGDALFFKFCFVDFRSKKDPLDVRFERLKTVVRGVHELCEKRDIALIVGTALPLAEPSAESRAIQERYNEWIAGYGAAHEDVLVFDLYSPLINDEGALRPELARGEDDEHPSDEAFDLLDAKLFAELPAWLDGRRALSSAASAPSPHPAGRRAD